MELVLLLPLGKAGFKLYFCFRWWVLRLLGIECLEVIGWFSVKGLQCWQEYMGIFFDYIFWILLAYCVESSIWSVPRCFNFLLGGKFCKWSQNAKLLSVETTTSALKKDQIHEMHMTLLLTYMSHLKFSQNCWILCPKNHEDPGCQCGHLAGWKDGPETLVGSSWLVGCQFWLLKDDTLTTDKCIYGRIWLSWFCCFIFLDLSHLRCRSCWRFSCSKFVAAQWFGLFPDLSH